MMKAEVPIQEADEVHEAQAQKRQKLREQKDESRSLLEGGGQAHAPQQQTEEKVMPVKSEKIANRNDKVNVQYPDGRVLKDVKYKKVEEDIKNGRCIVVEQ
ncbi:MAG: hypothetical protein QM734_08350 [Cyclobacteriaceae bacterium]